MAERLGGWVVGWVCGWVDGWLGGWLTGSGGVGRGGVGGWMGGWVHTKNTALRNVTWHVNSDLQCTYHVLECTYDAT